MIQNDSDFKKQLWLARVALAVSVILIGARSFGYESVEFDDPRMFFIHPHLRPLNWENLKWMFTDDSYNNHFYSPLLWLFYSIAGHVFGFTAPGQHVINVILHALCAAVLFEVLRELFAAARRNDTGSQHRIWMIWGPFVGVLFWALHPLRVEVTGWISARVHLHPAIFALGACWAYITLRRDADAAPWRRLLYWLAVALYGLSVLSFPTVIMLPVVLALLDFCLLRTHATLKTPQRLLRIATELLPFVIVAILPAAYSLAGNVAAIRNADTTVGDPLPPMEHVMAVCYVLWRYIWATLWPVGFAPMYKQLLSVRAADPLLIISTVMISGITITAFWLRRKWVGLWCAWLCYLTLMLPFIGLHGRPKYASDRYSYVGSIAIAALLGWLFVRAWSWRSAALRRRLVVTTASILILLGALSVRQIGIWSDSPTLFYVLIDKLGDSPVASTPMVHLASYLIDQDKPDEANKWLVRAYNVNPGDESIALAYLKSLEHRRDKAEKAADGSLAVCYADMIEFCVLNDSAEHRDVFFGVLVNAVQKISALEPRPADRGKVMRMLATGSLHVAQIFEQRRDLQNAAAWYNRTYEASQRMLPFEPDAQILDAKATACIKLNRMDEAAKALEKLISVQPEQAGPMIRLAYVRVAQNRRADAKNLLEQIAQRWPAMKPEVEKIRQSWPVAPSTQAR